MIQSLRELYHRIEPKCLIIQQYDNYNNIYGSLPIGTCNGLSFVLDVGALPED